MERKGDKVAPSNEGLERFESLLYDLVEMLLKHWNKLSDADRRRLMGDLRQLEQWYRENRGESSLWVRYWSAEVAKRYYKLSVNRKR